MAKDFSQFDNDNPVMSILSKAKEEEQQQDTSATETQSFAVKTSAVTVEQVNNTATTNEEVVESKRVLLNMNIRETTKKEWKMFFIEHDLSMTQGIETAVEYLISEVKKGNIRLTKGGITK